MVAGGCCVIMAFHVQMPSPFVKALAMTVTMLTKCNYLPPGKSFAELLI